MIVIVDYGMGNLRSVSKALESLGADVRVSADPSDVARADKVILPGVGSFPAAMRGLSVRRLVDPIKTSIARGTPYLGICLGLQVLFDRSDEGEGADGFGVLGGSVRCFSFESRATNHEPRFKIPHMGWNQVLMGRGRGDGGRGSCPLLDGVAEGSFFYFVHSYYAEPIDRGVVTLETDYGGRFVSMVWRDNLYATQFHPEKSQAVGLRLLENFVKL